MCNIVNCCLDSCKSEYHRYGLVGGFNPSEKYEFVSWDDDIPNIWKNKVHVPNHQPVVGFKSPSVLFMEKFQYPRGLS